MSDLQRQRAPAGYMWREDAERLTAQLRSEVDRIMRGIPDRVMARIAGAPHVGKAAAAALMVEGEAAMVEIQQVVALTIERVNAGEEH